MVRLASRSVGFSQNALAPVAPFRPCSGAMFAGRRPLASRDAGNWVEIEYDKLVKGHAHPHIQCWRDPPCIRWSW